jgi:tetratricopeptide (TPR) repeat protein
MAKKDFPSAVAEFARAGELFEQAADAHPRVARYQYQRAINDRNQCEAWRACNDAKAAARCCGEAIKTLTRLVKVSKREEYVAELARCHDTAGQLGRDGPDAAGHFDKAIELARSLGAGDPGRVCELGTYLVHRGDADDDGAAAAKCYQEAAGLAAGVLHKQPEFTPARTLAVRANRALAEVLTDRKEHAAAADCYDAALRSAAPGEVPNLRAHRAAAKARAGFIPLAVAEADQLRTGKVRGADDHYQLACVYALAAKARAGDAEIKRLRDLAFNLLERAVDSDDFGTASGITIRTLEGSEELAPLRADPRFAEILAKPRRGVGA